MFEWVSTTSAGRALTFGYSNARVKAMGAQLLSTKDLEQLVEAADIREMVSSLERTGYKEDLVATSLNHSGAPMVELSLGLNYARTAAKVRRISPQAAWPVLDAVLRKWDVHNLKTILLGKFEKKTRAEIEPFLVRCGSIPESRLRRLLDQDTLGKVLESLAETEYVPGLEKARKGFEKTQDLSGLLEALDLHYYGRLAEEVRGAYQDEKTIQRLVEAEVDAKNVLNALRLRREGNDSQYLETLFIEGGSLSREEMQRLLKASTFEALLEAVYKRMGLPHPGGQKSLAWLETQLEHKRIQQGLRALRRSTLSLGALVGFLYLKENEVTNVRKLLRAKEYRLSKQAVEEMLVMPA